MYETFGARIVTLYVNTEMILFNKNYYLEDKTHRCKIQNRKKKQRKRKQSWKRKK